MRTLTTLIATIGLLTAGLTAPLLLTPAGATTPASAASAAGHGTAPHPMRAKPRRDLHDSIDKVRGRLYFKGRVDPGHGPVIVQKKACSAPHCRWKTYKVVHTHGPQERWQVHVPAPRHGNWYWRGYVTAYGGYAKSWTGKWKTYTI